MSTLSINDGQPARQYPDHLFLAKWEAWVNREQKDLLEIGDGKPELHVTNRDWLIQSTPLGEDYFDRLTEKFKAENDGYEENDRHIRQVKHISVKSALFLKSSWDPFRQFVCSTALFCGKLSLVRVINFPFHQISEYSSLMELYLSDQTFLPQEGTSLRELLSCQESQVQTIHFVDCIFESYETFEHIKDGLKQSPLGMIGVHFNECDTIIDYDYHTEGIELGEVLDSLSVGSMTYANQTLKSFELHNNHGVCIDKADAKRLLSEHTSLVTVSLAGNADPSSAHDKYPRGFAREFTNAIKRNPELQELRLRHCSDLLWPKLFDSILRAIRGDHKLRLLDISGSLDDESSAQYSKILAKHLPSIKNLLVLGFDSEDCVHLYSREMKKAMYDNWSLQRIDIRLADCTFPKPLENDKCYVGFILERNRKFASVPRLIELLPKNINGDKCAFPQWAFVLRNLHDASRWEQKLRPRSERYDFPINATQFSHHSPLFRFLKESASSNGIDWITWVNTAKAESKLVDANRVLKEDRTTGNVALEGCNGLVSHQVEEEQHCSPVKIEKDSTKQNNSKLVIDSELIDCDNKASETVLLDRDDESTSQWAPEVQFPTAGTERGTQHNVIESHDDSMLFNGYDTTTRQDLEKTSNCLMVPARRHKIGKRALGEKGSSCPAKKLKSSSWTSVSSIFKWIPSCCKIRNEATHSHLPAP